MRNVDEIVGKYYIHTPLKNDGNFVTWFGSLNSKELESDLSTIINENRSKYDYVINLGNVEYVSTDAITAIRAFYTTFKSFKGTNTRQMHLIVTSSVKEIFELSGDLNFYETYDSMDQFYMRNKPNETKPYS